MEKRALGKTGLSLSALGFGGFHLLEIPSSDASLLLNSYLDRGGNYIETAGQGIDVHGDHTLISGNIIHNGRIRVSDKPGIGHPIQRIPEYTSQARSRTPNLAWKAEHPG